MICMECVKGIHLKRPHETEVGRQPCMCFDCIKGEAGRVDVVNHPPHYTFGKYEVIDVLEDWFADDPLLWQVAKYIARAKHKGNMVEDLKKARFYLERRIEKEERP